jgi:hypothetical protein
VTGWEALGWALTALVAGGIVLALTIPLAMILDWRRDRRDRRAILAYSRQLTEADTEAIWAELEAGP